MIASGDELPSLVSPPLIETVLGVQFAPILNFTRAHFGRYWAESLDSSWMKTIDAVELLDQFERFGEPSWKLPIPELRLMDSPPPGRVQFINADDDRVIQVQKSRFLYNWRKREATYPRFKIVFPDFNSKLRGFRDYLRAVGLEDINPNQWEVTYINHVPEGHLWSAPDDWQKVFPGLVSTPKPSLDLVRPASVSGEWHFEIWPQRGRLHISVQHGKLEDSGEQVLIVQLTARGPVDSVDGEMGLPQGIELGHRVLVRTFFDVCSELALDHWGVKRS
jgi:uncharacterized protein (TIGR04255 family)